MNVERARSKFEEAAASHEYDYEKFFLSRFFDLNFTYEDEICIVEVPVEDYLFNTHRTLHGGVIAFILDMSMAHLCQRFVGRGVTLEMKTQYLNAVDSGAVKCTASFLKKGKKIVHMESRMINQDGKPIAFATATFYLV